MRLKFGLLNHKLDEDRSVQYLAIYSLCQEYEACGVYRELCESFLDTMHQTGADFTNSFRCLSQHPLPDEKQEEASSNVLDYLMSQCSTKEELLKQSKPTVEARCTCTYIL
jgi:uncharacterized protein YdiU (UPF0061 family)